jgi:hypothetical protein
VVLKFRKSVFRHRGCDRGYRDIRDRVVDTRAASSSQALWEGAVAKAQRDSGCAIAEWYYANSGDPLVRSLRNWEKGTEDQAFRRLAMPAPRKGFAVCLRNGGFAASLEVRKLYPFINDPDAEANDLIRVIDESGEDYLYPARLFRKLALPSDIQRALRMAS